MRRRVVVTGATGFIGRAVVRTLARRGDSVVAAVRQPDRAAAASAAGAELVADDLSDVDRLAGHLRGADGLIHVAGAYRVGVSEAERDAMWDANVGATGRVLEAAAAATVPRIVYVSTCNVFGNTLGRTVDETYRRDPAAGFLSWYDETKFRAHELAAARQAAGAPVIIVMPSQAYGPGDHSAFGDQLRRAFEGRLRYRLLEDAGVGLVHVDDLAAGIVAALDRGRPGETYVLSGPHVRLRDAIGIAARLGGRRPPPLRLPTAVLRVLVPFGRLLGQPNLREVISAGAGVTYWASAAKAERELGFRPRGLEDGLRETFGAA